MPLYILEAGSACDRGGLSNSEEGHNASNCCNPFCRSVFKDPTYDNAMHVNGVPNTYLPVREGCRLTLYNDAHQVIARWGASALHCIARERFKDVA